MSDTPDMIKARLLFEKDLAAAQKRNTSPKLAEIAAAHAKKRFHDFESTLALPKVALAGLLKQAGEEEMSRMTMEGEYDF